MALILLQLLLRQSEGRVTHERRYGNLDPFWARALSMRATTVAVPTSLPQGPRDFLTRRALRLAEACLALISRIAQHRPHRRPFPPQRSPAGWDSAIVQQRAMALMLSPSLVYVSNTSRTTSASASITS